MNDLPTIIRQNAKAAGVSADQVAGELAARVERIGRGVPIPLPNNSDCSCSVPGHRASLKQKFGMPEKFGGART